MRSRNKYKTGRAVLLSLALLLPIFTQADETPAFSYASYAQALAAYVDDNGQVDYAGLKANRAGLDAFVDQLAALDPATVKTWNTGDRFALWMNAYNALTLKAVIDHYPVESIKDIGSVIKSVWDKLEFNVMGRTLTLNNIEHDVLRKEFGDARLHMAINCASIGCPPLGNEPLMADRLDEQFNALTRQFLADPTKFKIDRKKSVVHLSSIFKWFGGDFDKEEGGVINFVAKHLDEADRAYLMKGNFKTKYLDYDWNLNEQ